MSRRPATRRAFSIALALVAGSLAFAGTGPAGAAAIPLPDDDPFYRAPNPIPAVPPGTVIDSRSITITASGVPLPFEAWHVKFVSSDVNDAPSVAIATIINPANASTKKPRPLVSYQTAEDSLSMHCAPSYTMRVGTEKEEIALPFLLAQGWTVVVPDYEGMQSEYTVGIQAAHGVLDGIRAAVHFAPAGLDGLDTPIGLWGYSGGGLASAWAAEFAPTYAPELKIVAASEGGVPPDIPAVARNIDGGPFSAIELAGTVGMVRAYPQLASLLNAKGKAMMEDIGSMCIGDYLLPYSFKKMSSYSTVPDPLAVPWVMEIMDMNHLGHRTPAAAVFIFHSLNDELIPMADVNELVAGYCKRGATVAYYQDPVSDHSSLAVTGGPAALAHLASQFAGRPAPNTCGLPIMPPLTSGRL